ncbi:MAG: hypothetical protein HeimC2_28240, partial [Candidatus Heimdallarchaeota archaeon LC_2]
EWQKEYPDLDVDFGFMPWPKRCIPFVLDLYRKQGRWRDQMTLYHGTPHKFDTLEPMHDQYCYRKFSAISTTNVPTYAKAFGLIKNSISSDIKEIYVYKFEEESVKSEYQIGGREEVETAFDVLTEILDFEVIRYKVQGFTEEKRMWLNRALCKEIDSELQGEIESMVCEILKL